MAIDLEVLKSEREKLKTVLRDVEAEQRALEQQMKQLRQREIRGKRELDALSTLIDIHEPAKLEEEAQAGTAA